VFYRAADNPVVAISRDLCKVASFLQNQQPYVKFLRLDDWWEHDGLYFEKGSLNLHDLFQIVGTPRSLLEAVPGDDRVFVGVGATDGSWYLRFLVGWNDEGELILGEFSITLGEPLTRHFETAIPELECSIHHENAISFFARRSGA
jgi:hypothetical protein